MIPRWWTRQSLRDIGLDIFISFLCSERFDENDRDYLVFLADVVQNKTITFMARSKGKGRPISSKGAYGCRPRPIGLTVEDHNYKLQEIIKLRSTCNLRSEGPLVRRPRVPWERRREAISCIFCADYPSDG